jgi:hypothetical protein
MLNLLVQSLSWQRKSCLSSVIPIYILPIAITLQENPGIKPTPGNTLLHTDATGGLTALCRVAPSLRPRNEYHDLPHKKEEN